MCKIFYIIKNDFLDADSNDWQENEGIEKNPVGSPEEMWKKKAMVLRAEPLVIDNFLLSCGLLPQFFCREQPYGKTYNSISVEYDAKSTYINDNWVREGCIKGTSKKCL